MKTPSLALAALLTLSSCGLYQWWDIKPSDSERALASLSVQHLMADDDLSFNEEIQQKLEYLHRYYVLGQVHLAKFDYSMSGLNGRQLMQSDSYLSLLAIRTQTDEIEQELIELWAQPRQSRTALKRSTLLNTLIQKFAAKSPVQRSSMENLLYRFELTAGTKSVYPSQQDFATELKRLSIGKEFQIFEKNIEHLSHVMKTKISDTKHKVSEINGDEFPARVWSVTFNDGRGKTSPQILRTLEKNKIKGTFFQVASRGVSLNRDIASLAKVKLYRLPYGSSLNMPQLRQKIRESGMIHASWNVDTLDWLSQSPDKIVARTVKLMGKTNKDAGVLLFHDVHARTSEAMPQILGHLNKEGRRACSLEQIVGEMNEGSEVVCAKN